MEQSVTFLSLFSLLSVIGVHYPPMITQEKSPRLKTAYWKCPICFHKHHRQQLKKYDGLNHCHFHCNSVENNT